MAFRSYRPGDPGEKADSLRTGYTTGTCAAAAAKAAVMLFLDRPLAGEVEIALPNGARATLLVDCSGKEKGSAWAGVRKDAGDDPDVTDGALVVASVEVIAGQEVVMAAGEGVGTVTKPGLAAPPGEPAINPVPRAMIKDAVREVTDLGLRVTISIPGGEALAEKTFNPRLGVKGGLSILGTSGIVRPFSTSAIRDSLVCALRVAEASGVTAPVFVPGRIGQRAATALFDPAESQLIEVGNEWGFIIDRFGDHGFERLLVVGHPGKAAKLADDQWDTHSSRSRSAAPFVETLALEVIGSRPTSSATVEAIFAELPSEQRERLAVRLAALVGEAIRRRMGSACEISVVLVNLRGELLGSSGDLSPWQKRSS